MKIVNLLGGFGNQMFEYAMYLALKNEHPEEVIKCCTRSFRGYDLHNGLEIDRVFSLHITEASLWDLCKVAYPFLNYKTWQVVRHILPVRKTMTRGALNIPFDFTQVTRLGNTYYDGYWQNEKNFKHIREHVLKVFSFPPFTDKANRELSTQLIECNSLSCHIRRGDYLNDPAWGVCTTKYYREAIKRALNENNIDMICVFSDDISWCRKNLDIFFPNVDKKYVDWNKGKDSYKDMQLMTLCRHNIIANSSFSWWGAWLGQQKDKVVYAPSIWMKDNILNDPICDNWIRIDSE